MILTLFALMLAGDFYRPIAKPEPKPYADMLDTMTGFRGVEFRSAPNLGPEFLLYEDNIDTTVYRRPGDDLQFSGVEMDDVYYVFWRGKFLGGVALCSIAVHCLEPLYLAIVPMLGEGIFEEHEDRIVWPGEQAFLVLKREEDGTGRLLLLDKETIEEIRQTPSEK
tara:strand:+ start:2905 stop:3402 length:498 start_codon:yes stop_codon:yes gene_type:complete